jgi:restriction system protein
VTIIEAIKDVMRRHGRPMTYADAYEAIVENHLYEFHADDPASIVRSQIRRHCEGLDFPSAGATAAKGFKTSAEPGGEAKK